MYKKNRDKQSNLMRKNFIWNFTGTLIYAFASLIFMIVVTRINGVEIAGIFTFAFSFATIMQVFALYQGRTFQVTERNNEITDSDFLKFKLFSCFSMLFLATIFCLFRNYELNKIIIIFLLLSYKCLDGFSEAIYGIFQKYNNLYQAGISLFIKSVSCIVVFFLTDALTGDLVISTFSILLTDIFVFIFYDLIHLKQYHVLYNKFTISKFKILIFGGFAVFLFTFMSQYLANAQKYIIDFIASNTDQTIFGIIVMPATLVSLCAQLIINPFLYNINQLLKEEKYKQYKYLVLKICGIVLLLGAFIVTISFFIGIPILNLIYGLDLNEYLLALIIILIGSVMFGLVAVISNALIAIRKNTSQTIYYFIGCIISTILTLVLIPVLGIYGASIAFCAAYILLFIMFFLSFIYECKKLGD